MVKNQLSWTHRSLRVLVASLPHLRRISHERGCLGNGRGGNLLVQGSVSNLDGTVSTSKVAVWCSWPPAAARAMTDVCAQRACIGQKQCPHTHRFSSTWHTHFRISDHTTYKNGKGFFWFISEFRASARKKSFIFILLYWTYVKRDVTFYLNANIQRFFF